MSIRENLIRRLQQILALALIPGLLTTPPVALSQDGKQQGQPQQQPASSQAPGQTVQINAAMLRRAIRDYYRKKAQQLAGPRTVNGMAYQPDTIARAILARDIYVRELQKFIAETTPLADRGAFASDKWARYKKLAAALADLDYAQRMAEIAHDASEEYLLERADKYDNYANSLEQKYNGNPPEDVKEDIAINRKAAKDLRSLAHMSLVEREAAIRKLLADAMREDPLLNTQLAQAALKDPNSPFNNPNATDLEKIQWLNSVMDQAIQDAADEIKRVGGFNTYAEFLEFFKPQYGGVRFFAGTLYGENELANFEEFAKLYNQNLAEENQVTTLTWAVVLSGVAVVFIVAVPVAALAAGEVTSGDLAAGLIGGSVSAPGVVASTTAAVGTGANLGTVIVQLVWDGKELVAVKQELVNAQKGGAVIDPAQIADLQKKLEDAVARMDLDVIFIAISAKDFGTALGKLSEAQAKAAANAATSGSSSAAPQLSLMQRAELGAAKAKDLGVDPAAVDEMLDAAKQMPKGLQGSEQNRIHNYATGSAYQLASFNEIDSLLADARAAGVSEADIKGIMNSGPASEVATWTKIVPDRLKLATFFKQNKVLFASRTAAVQRRISSLLGGSSSPFVPGTSIPANVIYTEGLPNLQQISINLNFMRAGKPVVWSTADFRFLREILARPDANRLYGSAFEFAFVEVEQIGAKTRVVVTKTDEPVFFRLFSDEDLAAARQLMDAPNIRDIMDGKAILPGIVNPELVEFFTPSFLVDPQTGKLISASQVAQLTDAQIRQLAPVFVETQTAGPLRTALEHRMQQQAGLILTAQIGNAAQTAWAESVLRVAGPGSDYANTTDVLAIHKDGTAELTLASGAKYPAKINSSGSISFYLPGTSPSQAENEPILTTELKNVGGTLKETTSDGTSIYTGVSLFSNNTATPAPANAGTAGAAGSKNTAVVVVYKDGTVLVSGPGITAEGFPGRISGEGDKVTLKLYPPNTDIWGGKPLPKPVYDDLKPDWGTNFTVSPEDGTTIYKGVQVDSKLNSLLNGDTKKQATGNSPPGGVNQPAGENKPNQAPSGATGGGANNQQGQQRAGATNDSTGLNVPNLNPANNGSTAAVAASQSASFRDIRLPVTISLVSARSKTSKTGGGSPDDGSGIAVDPNLGGPEIDWGEIFRTWNNQTAQVLADLNNTTEDAGNQPVPPPVPTGGAGAGSAGLNVVNPLLLNATNTAVNAITVTIGNQNIVISAAVPSSTRSIPTAPADSNPMAASTRHRVAPHLQLVSLNLHHSWMGNPPRVLGRHAADEKSQAIDLTKALFSVVSNGKSSGQSVELQVFDPTGKIPDPALPDGTVLEPVKLGSAKSVAELKPGAKIIRKPQVAFCVDYLKLPPENGMLFRAAPADVQAKYGNIRPTLQAGRELADEGAFTPDGDVEAYKAFIQQYALWAVIQQWTEQQFTEVFRQKTKEKAAAAKMKWTDQLDRTVTALASKRWHDIILVKQRAAEIAKRQKTPNSGSTSSKPQVQ